MTFLVEHMEIDVGHTKFNEAELEKVLGLDPSYAEPLIQAGSAALEAYAMFLSECLEAAVEARKAASPAFGSISAGYTHS
jgi:hypothetical protein